MLVISFDEFDRTTRGQGLLSHVGQRPLFDSSTALITDILFWTVIIVENPIFQAVGEK